jgi:hypothetical protein
MPKPTEKFQQMQRDGHLIEFWILEETVNLVITNRPIWNGEAYEPEKGQYALSHKASKLSLAHCKNKKRLLEFAIQCEDKIPLASIVDTRSAKPQNDTFNTLLVEFNNQGNKYHVWKI